MLEYKSRRPLVAILNTFEIGKNFEIYTAKLDVMGEINVKMYKCNSVGH